MDCCWCPSQVWQLGEGAFGGLGSFLRSRSRCIKKLKVGPIADMAPVLSAGGGVAAVLKNCRMKWVKEKTLMLTREDGTMLQFNL